MAGAGARFLENQRDALAGERTARIGTRRQIEDRVQPPGVEIGDGEDVAGHQSAPFLTMVPMHSSVRSSIRLAARLVGTECVSKCRSRWPTYLSKNTLH